MTVQKFFQTAYIQKIDYEEAIKIEERQLYLGVFLTVFFKHQFSF